MKYELRECPFCGGTAIVDGEAYYWVHCTKCKAETRGHHSKIGAVNLWNKRAGDDQERVVDNGR
jgi:Lar family restriction alleviation protein